MLSLFFFLWLPPPPNSTLFPYTTLFRSRDHGLGHVVPRGPQTARGDHEPRAGQGFGYGGADRVGPIGDGGVACRSEEHTSELQSRGHLVCRLLLEKKK